MRERCHPLLTTFVGLLACAGCSDTIDGGTLPLPSQAGMSTSGGSGATGGTATSPAGSGGTSTAAQGGSSTNAGRGGTQTGGTTSQQAGAGGTGSGGSGEGAALGGGAGRSQGTGGAASGGSGNASQAGRGGSGAAGAAGSTQGLAGGGPVSNAPADVYEYYCSQCHGEQGVGGMYAPEIQHPVRDYSTWVVRHGLPGVNYRKPMEAIPANVISDAVLDTIWDWLDEPPQPTTGEGLYHDYCANCHGADGKGGPTMRPITDELKNLKTQVRKGSHPGAFDQRHEYMPVFSTTRLTDAEVQLIYDYVDSL